MSETPHAGPFMAEDDPAPPEAEAAGRAGKPKQAAELLALARMRYRMLISEDGRPYAVPLTGPNIALPIKGPAGVRVRLAAAYSGQHPDRVASQSALADTMAVLEGHAAQQEPEPVSLRVAQHADDVVLDLGTQRGRCVVINGQGWRVADVLPVVFRRSRLTSPIPEPVRTPDGLNLLRDLVNASEPAFRLLVAWLVCALIPDLPHPVLALRGEQCSAKSTAGRMLTMLIDPSPAPLRSAPRDIKQWAVLAAASYVVVLDNLSGIPGWLSDTLCRAVTGEGLVDRALYSDDDVSVLTFRRVVALTSIGTGSMAGDLAERLLVVELQPIPSTARRSENAVREAFDAARPAILGGLLDLLAAMLAELPGVELPGMPRMADFARVLAAIDHVKGWSTLADYLAGAEDTAADVLESSPFALAVHDLARQKGTWTGTASQLRELITEPESLPRGWPADATRVSLQLRRFAPALRLHGVEVDTDRDGSKHHRRLLTLTFFERKEGGSASAASDRQA